ncbi:hypothetical protein L211DRAFT_581903 [Terfezia boudieri ATCC MYA-4762]|uniref:Outer kinetochore protein DAD1 n=1 Tax=Terfezia boudieri ATCC MYA-4762 TaxID=1051890 RepID=A0A3N4LEB8_9PEZI|nr:hypothetical protein L211DRAFT_581903 [Terfezia boudieri ATCC MYA-4762]
MPPPEENLQYELQTLQLVRATFESVRQLVDAVHTDVATMTGNCEAFSDITKRWDEVVTLPEAEEGKKTAKKPAFGRT